MTPQFSIIVYPKLLEPFPVEDKALEWLDGNNLNRALNECRAEWVIIAHKSCIFSKNLLHRIAELIEEFRHVDCFAPWIESSENPGELISSGTILNLPQGILLEKDCYTKERTPMRQVAAPSPLFFVISKRIIQRTGAFDALLKTEIRFLDFGLRLYHTGGMIFSTPELRISVKKQANIAFENKIREKETAYILFKNLGLKNAFKYILKHLHTIPFLIKNFRTLWKKRRAATEFSKLDAEMMMRMSKDDGIA